MGTANGWVGELEAGREGRWGRGRGGVLISCVVGGIDEMRGCPR